MKKQQDEMEKKPLLMSRTWMWTLAALCLLPTLGSLALQEAGGVLEVPWPPSEEARLLTGPFLYVITQTCGFVLAIIAGLMCFAHFSRTGEITTSVLGVGLFCAGMLDIWQTLGAVHLVPVSTPMEVFIPLCWTATRGLYATVLIVAVSICILSNQVRGEQKRKDRMATIWSASAVFLVLTGATMFLVASRPAWSSDLLRVGLSHWAMNLGPLVLFILAGVYILPTYYRWHPSVFAQTLVISCLALGLAQMHFFFGSTGMVDWHFRAANLLKVIGYLVPLAGLLLDYQNTYAQMAGTNRALKDKLFLFEQSQDVSRQKQNVLDTLMGNLPNPIFLLDSSLRITQVNASMARRAGLSTPLLALGKTPGNLVGDEAGAEAQRIGKRVLKKAEAAEGEAAEVTFPDGSRETFVWTYTPVCDAEGRAVSVLCIGSVQMRQAA